MLNPEEDLKLKTICEFLFFDRLKNEATFPRFEQCFQPLFTESNLSMLSIFTEIAGEKRKYITFPRLVRAYQERSKSKDLTFFFDTLFNSIMKKDTDSIGTSLEKCYNYSTSITCGKRQCITLFEVLSDKDGIIHGFNITYDDVFKCKMYPKKIEDDLLVTLEMTLGLIDETPFKNKKVGKFLGLKAKNYKDSITHIFGTFNKEKGIISFLGFKCISGKMAYVGYPKGEGFLFGKFGSKLHDIKVQMTLEGITKLELGFETNVRKNFFLGSFGSLLNLKDDGPIKEEKQLMSLNDKIKINQMVTTPIVEDGHFFNKNLKDIISGNDYKEIVNQGGRNWIASMHMKRGPPPNFRLKTLDDCLKNFDEQHNIRGLINLKMKENMQYNGPHMPNMPPHMPPHMPHMPPHMPNMPNMPPHMPNIPFNNGKGSWYNRLLHRTKDFVRNSNKSKYRMPHGGKPGPSYYLFNKNNYLKLKEGLGKKIYSEFLKDTKEEDKEMKKTLLSQIVAEPGTSKRFNNNLNVGSTIKRNGGHANQIPQLLKTKLKGKEKSYDNKDMAKKRDMINKDTLRGPKSSDKSRKNKKSNDQGTFSFFSDGLKFFNDIGNFFGDDDDDDDDFFNFNKNTSSSNKNYNPFSNFGYGGYNYGNYGYNNFGYNNYGYNNYGYNYNYNNNYNNNFYPKKKEEPKYVYDPVKYKKAQENWKDFSEGIKSMNGVYLLQTIGSIIKALRILNEDDTGKNTISLTERIKLYKLLESNEAIINFLTQEKPKKENEEEEEPEETEDILVPDEHPEETTSLEELEQKIADLKVQLEKKNIKPDDKKKLEKLYNFYLQQKNILIENETKKKKDEIINQNEINVNKLIQEEEERRRKAQEEEEKRIEELQRQEEAKKKAEGVISTKDIPSEKNIYRDQQIYKGNTPWTDPLFPAEKKSLCPFDSKGWVLPEDVWDSDVDGWEKIKWCRAEEIFDSANFNVFEIRSKTDKHKISANDIQQGSIGDCYFLSVIGSLCNIYLKNGEKLIEDLFLHNKQTKEHVYGVYIFINGVWELVLVDDYFPYIGSNFKQFAFASSQGNELWVSILEKAWAKVNGCYAKIGCGGSPHEVFDVLTEAYSEQVSVSKSKANEIWNKMVESQKKGFVMTAGTSGDVSNLDIEEVGLSPGHAYTVLGVYELDGSRGKEKVVRLRNPWGNGEWNGDWSDSSSKWTTQLKNKMELSKKDDGDFYMSFNDFITYYVTMGFAKIHPEYETAVLKIKKEDAIRCQLIKVTVTQPKVHTYLSLYQKNPRIITKQGYYQKTSLCFMMLCDSNFNYLGSMSNTDMHICVEKNLTKGDYYIFCDVNYRYVGDNHGYNITSYGEHELILENLTKSNKVNIPQMFEKALISYCKVSGIKPNKDSRGIEMYTQNYGKDLPFMLLAFTNTSNNYFQANIETKARGTKSFCIYCDLDASEDDTKVTKQLPPNSSRAIVIMKHTNSSLFSISYSVSASSAAAAGASKNTNNINTNNRQNTEDDEVRNDPVFKTEGEAIDEDGYIIQYVKEEKNGFTIGIENRGRTKEKFKLILEGLDFTDSVNRGKGTSAPFELSPNQRKKWYVAMKQRYRGDLSFQFDYA